MEEKKVQYDSDGFRYIGTLGDHVIVLKNSEGKLLSAPSWLRKIFGDLEKSVHRKMQISRTEVSRKEVHLDASGSSYYITFYSIHNVTGTVSYLTKESITKEGGRKKTSYQILSCPVPLDILSGYLKNIPIKHLRRLSTIFDDLTDFGKKRRRSRTKTRRR